MTKLNICIIGAGHMGRIHAKYWATVPDANIVAIVDPDQELATALAVQVGGAVFADVETAVSHPDVTVVSICTPTFLHPTFAIFAAQQGKHVLCEKPIALTHKEADAMKTAAQQAGTHLTIGLMRRYSPLMPVLRDWIGENHLGRPLLAQTVNIMPLRPKRAMHDAHANGGPLIDMLVHFVDTWSILFQSEPVSVTAQGMILAQDRPEIEHIAEKAVDTAVLIIRFGSGDVGNVFLSWGMPPDAGIKTHTEHYLGANGMLTARFSMDEQSASWRDQNGNDALIFETTDSMYQQEIIQFAHELRSGKPNYATVDAAIRALNVSLAALESIKTNQTVFL